MYAASGSRCGFTRMEDPVCGGDGLKGGKRYSPCRSFTKGGFVRCLVLEDCDGVCILYFSCDSGMGSPFQQGADGTL